MNTMDGFPQMRVPAGIAVAFGAAALAAPAASAHPVDPEGARLVAPLTSMTASAKPAKAKPAKRRLAPRPKPALEP
jgi:hypothetical protein